MQSSDAKSRCSLALCTDPAAVRENGDAKSAATASDISIGAGAVLLAAGAYFFFTAPTSASSPVGLAPLIERQLIGGELRAVW
jgi:hypothetical protein